MPPRKQERDHDADAVHSSLATNDSVWRQVPHSQEGRDGDSRRERGTCRLSQGPLADPGAGPRTSPRLRPFSRSADVVVRPASVRTVGVRLSTRERSAGTFLQLYRSLPTARDVGLRWPNRRSGGRGRPVRCPGSWTVKALLSGVPPYIQRTPCLLVPATDGLASRSGLLSRRGTPRKMSRGVTATSTWGAADIPWNG